MQDETYTKKTVQNQTQTGGEPREDAVCDKRSASPCILGMLLYCCFTSTVNIEGHVGRVR